MNLENVRIVLVGPLYGGNVGSVCRAMSNTGIKELAIADPRPLNMLEARMMSCHAEPLLRARQTFDTLAEAVADCGLVIGTSARRGLYRQHAKSPRDWAPTILEASAHSKVGLVFGREDKGLSNEELALCTHIVQIPTTDESMSINLAQSVMICCYELFTAAGIYEPPEEKSGEAPSALRERMFGLWRAMMLDVGFMEPDKADHMMLGLRRILGRGVHTLDDVKIMMGIARQAQWASGQTEAGGPSVALRAMEGKRRSEVGSRKSEVGGRDHG
ncbi:MAG: RNA methyltransferase [Verrucomicrobia bacterium]|jgi:tRNA/rRNA methyltransferase|nr:RNA methyltransferase [Verrucomicrobiota bacterium]MBT7066951.1 RNA methyltransferase [Verrucomicrobiota bacterium]